MQAVTRNWYSIFESAAALLVCTCSHWCIIKLIAGFKFFYLIIFSCLTIIFIYYIQQIDQRQE